MADLSKNVWGIKSKSKRNVDDEEPEDILYPTMNGIKDEIKKQSSPFKSNSKEKTGAALGESIYDADDNFKDLNIKKYDDDDKISDQIKPEKESNQKFKEAAEILYKYPIDKKSEKSDISDPETCSTKEDDIYGNEPSEPSEDNNFCLKGKISYTSRKKGNNLNTGNNIKNKISDLQIKKSENTEMNYSAQSEGKDILPEIVKYIKENTTKTYKKTETDIKLFKKLYPYCKSFIKNELNQMFKSDNSQKNKSLMNKFLNLLEEDKNNPEIIQEMLYDFMNGGDLSLSAASSIGGIPDAAGLLRVNGKNSDLNISYTDDAIKYNSSEELPEKYRSVINEKLRSQGLNPNSKGFFFNSDSGFSTRIAESEEMENKISEIIKEIPGGYDYKNKKRDSIEFKSSNLYYAVHNADIHNIERDMFGNISGDIIDTTDFNAGEDEPKLVKEAKKLQDKGIIEPKFIIVHFVIPEERVRKICENEEKREREKNKNK